MISYIQKFLNVKLVGLYIISSLGENSRLLVDKILVWQDLIYHINNVFFILPVKFLMSILFECESVFINLFFDSLHKTFPYKVSYLFEGYVAFFFLAIIRVRVSILCVSEIVDRDHNFRHLLSKLIL